MLTDNACRLLVTGVAAVLATPSLAQISFTERAAYAGCSHVHATVRNIPDMEFMAGGGAVGDFNRNGYQDIFVLGGSAGLDRLFMNNGDGTFTDVSEAAGILRQHRGTGVAVGDFNNNGLLDIFVTSIGTATAEGPCNNILYRNNGDGTFTDVAAQAGVQCNNPNQGDAFGAAFGDFDGDGLLDLAVSGWLGGNRLYRNNGDGTFTDVTATALPADMHTVRGFAPRFVDMDGNGHPDLLWVADFLTSRYLVNNGDGTFTDATAPSGTGLDSNGMGNTFGDFENRGVLDWYVTSRINHSMTDGSGNMLYRQVAPHVFEEVSVAAGVNFGYWGWGTEAADFDHDGYLDIVATNGFDGSFATDPTQLFRNNGDGTFTDIAPAAGVAHQTQGRGLLVADLNNNGARDIIVFNNRQPMQFYQNDMADPAGSSITLFFNTRHFPGLAPDGFGTRVSLTASGMSQLRYLDGGTTYTAQSELSVHFGLAGANTANIEITYANGHVETLAGVRPGRYTITVRPCIADYFPDGNIDIFDVLEFLAAFSEQHPQADITGDGRHDIFDVIEFLALFEAGCPG